VLHLSFSNALFFRPVAERWKSRESLTSQTSPRSEAQAEALPQVATLETESSGPLKEARQKSSVRLILDAEAGEWTGFYSSALASCPSRGQRSREHCPK